MNDTLSIIINEILIKHNYINLFEELKKRIIINEYLIRVNCSRYI